MQVTFSSEDDDLHRVLDVVGAVYGVTAVVRGGDEAEDQAPADGGGGPRAKPRHG